MAEFGLNRYTEAAVIAIVAAVFVISSTSAFDICDPIGETRSENFLTISETAEIDDVVFQVTVFGESNQVDLKGRYNEYFAFERKTRNVVVNATLDSDIDSLESQKLIVECTDKTTTRKVTINFIIAIKDANDNAPVFTQDVYNVSIGEMTDLLDVINTGVKATDNDASTKFNIIYYSIMESQYSDYFLIRNQLKTGMTLLKPLDYETLREFSITIVAKDFWDQSPGNTGFNSTCKVVIQVEDEDDQYPVFESSIYKAVISDMATPNAQIVVTPPIAAYDPDMTLMARVEYSFHDAAAQSETLFSIDGSTGNVTLLKRPSMEDIYLLLQATQVDNPSRYGVALLTIHVQGSNVNAPTFTRPTYKVTRTEAFPVGQTVATVMASDKEGSPVSYSLADSANRAFAIDSTSGDITLLQPLNYEKQPSVTVQVVASDGELTNTAEIDIRVYPADNQPPRVLTTNLNVTASRRKGSVVIDLDAEDPDPGDQVSFKLLNSNDIFSIDSQGRIRIVSEVDALTLNTYELIVIISDGRQPSFERATLVIIRFPPVETAVYGASVASDEEMIPIILGGVAGVFFIFVIILIVYVMRNRFKYKEHLDRAKKQYPSQDPKALAFKQKTMSRKGAAKLNRIEFRGDEEEDVDGATSVQDNPLSANNKGSYFNFGQVHSDTETEVDPNEIQVETSVVPYDHHRNNDDNNNTDNVYNTSQYSVESDDYNSIDKNVLNTLYRNGSLSTYRESSGSDTSLNASPTESADSKKVLVPGGTSSHSNQTIHKTRIPEENGGYWEIQDSNNPALPPTVSNSANSNNTQPAPPNKELTVYF